MSAYANDVVVSAFDRSRGLFEGLVGVLSAPLAEAWTHGDLEVRLGELGRDLLRQLFQDHADLRSVREERLVEVTGDDGIARTRVERGHTRVLATVFGEVSVERLAYRAVRAGNLHPADAVWNLPPGKHSHGLGRLVALESVRGSFQGAQAAVERATGVRVGKRQLEDLAVAAAVDITDFYTGRRPEPTGSDVLLVLTFDGKGVVMRPEALREATRKAAAASSPKLATRVSPGEKTGRKRMAELACVYDAKPAIRTAGDVIGRPGGTSDRKRAAGPQAAGKWLTASIRHSLGEVIAAGFDEAQRRDPRQRRTWVVLVDGNQPQIDAIRAEAKRRDVTVHILIDFIHVAEYVWGAAWSFFDKGDSDAENWVADQLTKILSGKARQVAAGIRRRATTYGFTGTERKRADDAARYLTNHHSRLGYDNALDQGWPIATGVIEGACRHLVKDRLDITGARWGLPGAEAILHLRSMIINGDFDAYWIFHLQREHERNHDSRYQQHPADYTLAA